MACRPRVRVAANRHRRSRRPAVVARPERLGYEGMVALEGRRATRRMPRPVSAPSSRPAGGGGLDHLTCRRAGPCGIEHRGAGDGVPRVDRGRSVLITRRGGSRWRRRSVARRRGHGGDAAAVDAALPARGPCPTRLPPPRVSGRPSAAWSRRHRRGPEWQQRRRPGNASRRHPAAPSRPSRARSSRRRAVAPSRRRAVVPKGHGESSSNPSSRARRSSA